MLNRKSFSKKDDKKSNLQKKVIQQVFNIFQIGCVARQVGDENLSLLCAYTVFDLVDWLRKNSPEEKDSFLELMSQHNINIEGCFPVPNNLSEMENFTEKYICNNNNKKKNGKNKNS